MRLGQIIHPNKAPQLAWPTRAEFCLRTVTPMGIPQPTRSWGSMLCLGSKLHSGLSSDSQDTSADVCVMLGKLKHFLSLSVNVPPVDYPISIAGPFSDVKRPVKLAKVAAFHRLLENVRKEDC